MSEYVELNATRQYMIVDTTLSACGAKALLNRECPLGWIKISWTGLIPRWMLRSRSVLPVDHTDAKPGFRRYIFTM